MRRIALGIALSATVFATTSCSGGGSGSPAATAPLAPNNAAPAVTASPTPSSASGAAHTVSISGDPTFTSLGITQVYTASETHSAIGAYFYASLNAACNGAASLSGASGPMPAPPGEVGGSEFYVFSLFDSTSCALTVTATDTGASASMQLQIVAPMVTASPIPVQ